VVITFLLLLYN